MKKILALSLLAGVVVTANAQSFTDGFEPLTAGVGFTGLTGTINSTHTWTYVNASSPIGTTSWTPQSTAVFPAHAGTNYMSVNFNSTAGTGTINNFLMSSVRTFNNGDTISFWTRQVANNTFPDRLNLRLSTAGASTNVADFSTNLLTINPSLTASGYPSVWTQFSVTLTGLGGPTSGRFAFHYDVPNGGPSGDNSNYLGIDTVAYQAVPEPATMAALGLGALAVIRRRRASK